MIRLALCLTCLLWAHAAVADAGPARLSEPQFETVFDEQQPQFSTTLALCQDRQGLLWIGSLYGLVSYDGYRTQRYLHVEGDPHSLPSDYIRALAADGAGRVWVGTDADGLASYDPLQQRFQRYRHDPADPQSLVDDSVWALADDGQRGLWVGTNAGLDYRPADGRGFVHLRQGGKEGLTDGRIRRLLVDTAGTVWVGSESGLQRRPEVSQVFETIAPDALTGHSVSALLEAGDGKVWAAAIGAGVGWITPGTARWTGLPDDTLQILRGREVIAMVQPTASEIWLRIENGGIAVVSAADGRLLHEIVPDPAMPGSLLSAGTKYEAMLRDRSGLIWVSATGAGLQKHNPINPAFQVYRHHAFRPETLSTSAINTLHAGADGLIWIGTDGNGVDFFDRRRGVVDSLRPSPVAGGLADGVIRALAETADGYAWIGTQRGGLYRYDRRSRQLRQFTTAEGLPENAVRKIVPDHAGGLWLGTNAGVAHLDTATYRVQTLALQDGRPMQSRVRTLLVDRRQRLWVGTASGLFLREPGKAGLRQVGAGHGEPALSQPSIYGLHLDGDERLWVSTESGLDRLTGFIGDTPQFESISRRLGIPGQALGENLISDPQGRLWTGAQMIDPAHWTLTRLGRAEGADIGTIWGGAYARSADGIMWFGSRKGLLAIDPQAYQPWSFQPPVVVTQLKLDGAPVPLRRLHEGLELDPDTRGFSVEFAALDFSAPQRLRYRYRLAEVDPTWLETDADSRIASYGGLWPGRYTLQVQGSNRNGDWSPHALSMTVTVLPAFWQTAWFATALTAGLALVGYAGVRWRTRVIRRRADQLAATVANRTAELQQANRELVETQQQLVIREKLASLGTLTAGVAHEINNPTNFADGAVQNLQHQLQVFRQLLRRLAGDDADPAVLATIDRHFDQFALMTATAREGHERIKRIVGDLRQFTRLDEADRKRVHIGEPIQSTLNLIRTRYDRIAFQLDLAANPEIECQPARLGQVFMNLVINACEATAATDRPGWVRITTVQTDAEVMIHVDDNGPGMDEVIRQRVFEPFFTTKEVGQGTGLGLSISLGIVREHGGSIEVESAPGQGCRFSVRLPLPGVRP